MVEFLKQNKVKITVDRSFFDNIFEPERKRIENKLKIRVTQKQFTSMLEKAKVPLRLPLPKKIGVKLPTKLKGKPLGRRSNFQGIL